ncbi:MAG TPA: TRAM domain-containing protein [Kofleriaceae bacterium]|nr:TRAM domain-containing protein [Kofleriaceae bacterium]
MTTPRGTGTVARVDVHALAAGGDGIGRDRSGRATFIAGTAPGDVVRARVVEAHARWARAELVAIDVRSPARVEPPCPLFVAGTCGGCQWQHVTVEAQRAAKQQLVAGALRRLIGAGLELRPLLAPVADYHWRRRARWSVAGGAIGFHAPRSHAVADLAGVCLQVEPALDAVLVAIRDGAVIAPGATGEIHAAVGPGGAHVVLAVPVDDAAAAALVGRAGIAGVAWPGGAAGAAAIELEPGLWGRGDDFAQASAAGNDALRALVRDACAVAPGARVLELHAGGGNFTRDLLAAGADVTAVDERPPSRPIGSVVTGPAAEVVARLGRDGARFEVVLLDPPRTGARDVVGALAALGPRRIIYVSCDPATFARDADVLAAAGLTPRWAQALDLMPQTAHVELVACFEAA